MTMNEFLGLVRGAGFDSAEAATGGTMLMVGGEFSGMVSPVANGQLMVSLAYPEKLASLGIGFDHAELSDDTNNVILYVAGSPVGVLSCRA